MLSCYISSPFLEKKGGEIKNITGQKNFLVLFLPLFRFYLTIIPSPPGMGQMGRIYTHVLNIAPRNLVSVIFCIFLIESGLYL